ncbi:MAG: DNA recombination/repair protein RecA [Dehalococcoidia bacterium]
MAVQTKQVLSTVLQALNKRWGRGAAALLGDGSLRCEVDEVIPTGLAVLDHHVIGIGGLPVGRISELYSEEGTGKTSLMLQCLASAQQHGGVAILIETENALQPEWASGVHGVDTEQLLVIEAEALEDATEKIGHVLSALPPNTDSALIAWDSVASTPTKKEVETGEQDVGGRARLLSSFCRQIVSKLKRRHAHLMFVNQVRDNIGVMFGNKLVTPGGHAIKFASSVRLQLFAGKALKDDNSDHVGRIITVLASKNKLHPPWRKARLRLDYRAGWDDRWSTLTHAKERKLVPPRVRSEQAYRDALEKLGWEPTK